MTKEEIYNKIGYYDKYDSKVKKALNSLIKKYHPDRNNGDDTIFKMVYEVKKELESNKSTRKRNKSNYAKAERTYYNNMDDMYYLQRLNELNNNKDTLNTKIKNNYKIIYDYYKKYGTLYNNYQNNLIKRVNIIYQIDKLNKLKIYDIIRLLIIVLNIFSYIIFKESILLYLLLVFVAIEIAIFTRKMIVINKLRVDNKSNLDDTMNIKMEQIKNSINNLENKTVELERELNNVNNDIRFYSNEINKKKEFDKLYKSSI